MALPMATTVRRRELGDLAGEQPLEPAVGVDRVGEVGQLDALG
jgi:hypothetical protein